MTESIGREDRTVRELRIVAISVCLFVVTFERLRPAGQLRFLTFRRPGYVFQNPPVRRGLSWAGLVWAATTFHAANWHPLTWLSHMLDCQLFGLNARAHHLTSLLLHGANTVGLFVVWRRLTGATWRPALVAALFALHPLHVESVAWMAERKDVLSTWFGILTLGAYARYVESPRLSRYLWVVALFALALLAKPMLVTLPFVLLLLDYWPLRRAVGWRGLVLEKVPLLVLSLAACVMTFLAQIAGGTVASLERVPLAARLSNALLAYVAYLRKAVWPVDLAIYYPHSGRDVPLWQPLAAGVLLLAVTVLAVALRRRRPALLVGWLWYLGMLVPVIGLVQVGTQSMADRYSYLPLVGVFVALAWRCWRPLPAGAGAGPGRRRRR